MLPFTASEKPVYNPIVSQELVDACATPFTKKPADAGLRAVFAVMQRHHFNKDEDAWTYYSSSKQRYYEWKPCVLATQPLLSAASDVDLQDDFLVRAVCASIPPPKPPRISRALYGAGRASSSSSYDSPR